MSNRTQILLSSLLALSATFSLRAEPLIQDVSANTESVSNNKQAEEPRYVKSVPAGQDYPDGFDRSRLTPPEINTVEEFLQFTEKVRAIPYEEINEEKRLRVYYRELMFAKNRAIVAAADDLLKKTRTQKISSGSTPSSSMSFAALGTRARKNAMHSMLTRASCQPAQTCNSGPFLPRRN